MTENMGCSFRLTVGDYNADVGLASLPVEMTPTYTIREVLLPQ